MVTVAMGLLASTVAIRTAAGVASVVGVSRCVCGVGEWVGGLAKRDDVPLGDGVPSVANVSRVWV